MTITTEQWIELDGAQGEGGGQILRSALTLSMITGIPFRMTRIRARRSKPGLLRQHLTAVQAAQAICDANVTGAAISSGELHFRPGRIKGGDYQFAIGTAGSCTLVLQTVLPALWFADVASSLSVSGGTHNPMAPPADFLIRAWLPLVQRMGANCSLHLKRHGFFPAGGGEVTAQITPCQALSPLQLTERGTSRQLQAEAIIAGVPYSVAQRELDRVKAQMSYVDTKVRDAGGREGPGNALLITVMHDEVVEVFTGFGEKGVSAEKVANQAAEAARHYIASGVAVGEHLADQLVLPMALAGGGSFTTHVQSSHLTTNLSVIEKFLPVETNMTQCDNGTWLVTIS
ncbi:RNA 3'-terminal phosphate cyclase [Chitinivorax sp. B]|uniref:RNA 3'-terminal phosphate cyclase n=1 Tax=Chitinivorax sp. B TaxID=2502235 RepID=UPI0010F9038A|nr:RNA 3'-terminal phosphate cyclase [Chitinivorax sp. B]